MLDTDDRRVLLALLDLTGYLGLPTLSELFPDAPRRELIDIKRCHARLHRRDRRHLIRSLRWTRPGAVWAIDFSQPPTRIDGQYPRLLCIRDLSSGYSLLAIPAPDESARCALTALRVLTRWAGAPLVLKCDNGSAFISAEVKAWADRHGVLLHYSPPAYPKYNGAIEAGIGSIKARAFWAAGNHDRPWHWTCDDVEAARCATNEYSRPRGPHAGSPKAMWHERQPISVEERARFLATYRAWYAREKERAGWPEQARMQHAEQAAIDRVAITRGLLEHGLMLYRRRRITLPIAKPFSSKIS